MLYDVLVKNCLKRLQKNCKKKTNTFLWEWQNVIYVWRIHEKFILLRYIFKNIFKLCIEKKERACWNWNILKVFFVSVLALGSAELLQSRKHSSLNCLLNGEFQTGCKHFIHSGYIRMDDSFNPPILSTSILSTCCCLFSLFIRRFHSYS